MKRSILIAALLAGLPVAHAEGPLSDVSFSDGRQCKKCVVDIKQGFAVSVKDGNGQEWLDPAKPMTLMVYKSGGINWTYHSYTSPAGPAQEQTTGEQVPYWKKRYNELVSEIDLCGSSTADKSLCLLQVKQLEAQKDQALQQVQLQAQQVQIQQFQAIRNLAPTRTNCYGSGNQVNCTSY